MQATVQGGNEPSKRAWGRSLSDFWLEGVPGRLHPGEGKLLEACRLGELCSLGDRVPDKSSPDQLIRASLVRFLALGGDEDAPVHEAGVRLTGAWLEGVLDVSDIAGTRPLFLPFSRIERVDARGASLPLLFLDDARIEQGLFAQGLRCAGTLSLTGAQVAGACRFVGAKIGGDLSCSGALLRPSAGAALDGDGLDVAGSAFLDAGFRAAGECRFVGAKIGSDLNLSGGSFQPASNRAITCDRVTVGGAAWLSGGLTATGLVSFAGANIKGPLVFSGGSIETATGDALSCTWSKIGGDLVLNDGFRARGAIRLYDAEVGGNLNCSKASIIVAEGEAMAADRLRVKGSAFLRNGFKASGEVRLVSADIGGDLDCSDGRFEAKENALICNRIRIKDGANLRDGFRAVGKVWFVQAEIGGNLDCAGGRFQTEADKSFICDGIRIRGNAFLRLGFHATGQVRLVSAKIDGDLDCSSGRFQGLDGSALSCARADVGGTFFVRSLRGEGEIRLESMHATALSDEEQSWDGARGNLILDGFTYDRIEGYPAWVDANERIGWLRLQRPDQLASEFRPQPWEQLTKVLRQMGHPNAARRVAREKQVALRRAGRVRGWPARALHTLYGSLVGYGYLPTRLLGFVLGIWAVCALAYLAQATPGATQQASEDSAFVVAAPQKAGVGGQSAQDAATSGQSAPSADSAPGRAIDPWLYSLDALLPIDLGYQSAFRFSDLHDWGPLLRWMATVETIFGWIATVLLLGVAGNLFKKD